MSNAVTRNNAVSGVSREWHVDVPWPYGEQNCVLCNTCIRIYPLEKKTVEVKKFLETIYFSFSEILNIRSNHT